jgi:hypothetical protein
MGNSDIPRKYVAPLWREIAQAREWVKLFAINKNDKYPEYKK